MSKKNKGTNVNATATTTATKAVAASETNGTPTSEVLESFEFKAFGGDRQSYPWDDWLDGQIRKLTSGTSYNCKDATMLTLARTAARRRKLALKTRKVEGGVVIQAQEPSIDQLAKWEAEDAETEAAASEATETEVAAE